MLLNLVIVFKSLQHLTLSSGSMRTLVVGKTHPWLHVFLKQSLTKFKVKERKWLKYCKWEKHWKHLILGPVTEFGLQKASSKLV